MNRSGWKGVSQATVTIVSDAVFTNIATIYPREGSSNLWFEFDMTADADLTAFNTDVRSHSDANWHTVANATSDYTTNIQAPIKGVDNDPVTLAASGASLVWLDVKGLNAIRFQAKSGASDAIVSDYNWQVR